MNKHIVLNYDNVIEENLSSKLDGKIIMDFVKVNKNRTGDDLDFDNWKNDFINKKIPFIITKNVRPMKKHYKDEVWYTLWKEQIAFTPFQLKNINKCEIFNMKKLRRINESH